MDDAKCDLCGLLKAHHGRHGECPPSSRFVDAFARKCEPAPAARIESLTRDAATAGEPVEEFLRVFYAADLIEGYEGWDTFTPTHQERLRAQAAKALAATAAPQVAALTEELARVQKALDETEVAGIYAEFTGPADAIEQMARHIDDVVADAAYDAKCTRERIAESESEVASLTASLEAANRKAAQVEEDDLLVFLDDSFSGGNEIRFVPTRDPIGERTEERDGATIVWVDDPPSINDEGDSERPHETLSDALRDWYKRDARALPAGDAPR